MSGGNSSDDLNQGDRVIIKNDGDGAENSLGTVRTIYKSGRCRIDLDGGGFRNLSPIQFEKVQQ